MFVFQFVLKFWKKCGLPFDKFNVGVLADVDLSLLTDWPDGSVELLVFVSVFSDCGGADIVGVFGGDSSLTCLADFNLSITALNELLLFLFAWLLLPDDLIESWLDDDASIKVSIGMNEVDTFV